MSYLAENLTRYDLQTGQCNSTSYAPNRNGSRIHPYFPITSAQHWAGTNEALYAVWNNALVGELTIIDTKTFNRTTLNSYSNNNTLLMHLASNWTGNLFALNFDYSNNSTYWISQINVTSGQIQSQYPLNANSSNLGFSEALTSYWDQFFFFRSDGNMTAVYRIQPWTYQYITLVATIPKLIVSASTAYFQPSCSNTTTLAIKTSKSS